MSSSRRGRYRKTLTVSAVLVLGALLALAAFRTGPAPRIRIETGMPGIGRRTPITVIVQEPRRGLAEVSVELIQGDRIEPLAARSFTPLSPWKVWGARTGLEEIRLDVGSDTVPGLKEGEATLRVVASRAESWLRRPAPAVEERTLPVRLTPPSIHVLSTATYVSAGGCEVVVYRVGESATADGVRSDEHFFPGYPLPGGGTQDRFALFAVSHELEDSSKVRLVASDDVGNEAAVGFVDRFSPQPVRAETIQLTDEFMERVVPDILSQTPGLRDAGDLLENYLAINGELRRANGEALEALASRSAERFLWGRPFLSMPNAKVMSSFAIRRIYRYRGRTVDRQIHLGYDLASVRAAEVPAANDGVVVMARYFGIYGNAVILDHGYGLMTLYGHLSSIDVEEGQAVARGEVLGRTGSTGLAGGDHLHFSTLLGGVPVTPKEWWDKRWIRNRIAAKLGPALAFEE